jgi:hypothetical protein
LRTGNSRSNQREDTMETHALEVELTGSQYSTFAMRCRWLGHRPEQFRITFDPLETEALLPSMVRVTLLPYGRQRRYYLDHFFEWLDQFELDLLAGAFEARADDPWR